MAAHSCRIEPTAIQQLWAARILPSVRHQGENSNPAPPSISSISRDREEALVNKTGSECTNLSFQNLMDLPSPRLQPTPFSTSFHILLVPLKRWTYILMLSKHFYLQTLLLHQTPTQLHEKGFVSRESSQNPQLPLILSSTNLIPNQEMRFLSIIIITPHKITANLIHVITSFNRKKRGLHTIEQDSIEDHLGERHTSYKNAFKIP